ncbi:MAG: helix-turn-helix domain-containing protein [Bavariicoccus seileri]|uniref:helix-turn-helix domain-containing protein n=1 Tax=Bavariicoccus seileri TaxID=549685 RepID=UPI003F9DB845
MEDKIIFSSVMLHKRILVILDNQVDFISINHLAKLLKIPSVNSVKRSCDNLRQSITANFDDSQVELLMSKGKGIKLKRNSVNIRRIVEKLYEEEFFYSVFKYLYSKRSVSTTEFCLSNHVSESQLRRKIRYANQELNKYNVNISVGSRISVKGDEFKIRSWGFSFLYLVHGSIRDVSWIKNSNFYIDIAREVLSHLEVSTTDYMVDIVALLCYINYKTKDSPYRLKLTKEKEQYLKQISFPPPPKNLENWNHADWIYLVTALYGFNLFDFKLTIDPSRIKSGISLVYMDSWISFFEEEFRILTDDEKNNLYKNYYKDILLFRIVQMDADFLVSFTTIDTKRISSQYPTFYQKFERFWSNFLKANPSRGSDYLRNESLLMCLNLTPAKELLPTVSVYLFTNYPVVISNFLKDRITVHFTNSYHVKFTLDTEEADLFISTSCRTPTPQNKEIAAKPTVIVNRQPSARDFQLLEETMEKVIKIY